MTSEKQLGAMLALPDPEMMAATSGDNPKSGMFYSAETVVLLLASARAKEREACANVCEDVAGDTDNWEDGGEDGRVAAMECARLIRARNAGVTGT